MENYLKNLGFSAFTSMQSEYLKEDDNFTILLANTGSGKTVAFLLKLISFLEKNPNFEQILILSPTRELAQQSFKVLQSLRLPYSSILCYGGHSFKNEELQFSQNPQLIIATPGRILDHFERKTPGLKKFSIAIIDEYDKTLELGFLSELTQIFEFSSKLQSIQLVSATEIESLPRFLSDFSFKTCNFLEDQSPDISFFSIKAQENDKLKALALLLNEFDLEPTLVFCTHREACERIAEHLFQYGKKTAVFHGGLEQDDRQLALFKFKSGVVDCLICSDLASRGIDISEVKNIIHYQFPQTKEDFTHRNGRTARMTKSGKVYLIHSENEPLPEYCSTIDLKKTTTKQEFEDYKESKFCATFLNIGRKDKVRKLDIVGFLTKEFSIPFEKIGMIEIYDNFTYLALEEETFHKHKNEFQIGMKLKKNKFKIRLSR